MKWLSVDDNFEFFTEDMRSWKLSMLLMGQAWNCQVYQYTAKQDCTGDIGSASYLRMMMARNGYGRLIQLCPSVSGRMLINYDKHQWGKL